MKKITLLLIFAFGSSVSIAQTQFTQGDLTYEILSKEAHTVEVHDCNESVSNEISIPTTVSYSGENYSVVAIGNSAFYDCNGLTSITIPNSVITIGGSAFSSCHNLTSITIPNSVTTIGPSAFFGCSMTSITLPNSVTTIGNTAFAMCEGLTSVTIPNSVTTIGSAPFLACFNLATINVDSGNNHYKSIDGVLFEYNETMLIQYPIGNNRTSYTIPNTVVTIGDYAFNHCTLTSIIIPNSVITIRKDVFRDCPVLTSIIIPNSVTTIGDNAFAVCDALKSVTIGNSVTSIGNYAFASCDRLQEVINFAIQPQQISSNVFDFVNLTNALLFVPSSSVEKYKNTNVWKNFGTIKGNDAGVNAVNTDKIVISDGKLWNPKGEEIRIYNQNGYNIYCGNNYELRLPAGLYILQTSSGSRKVIF